MIKDSNQKKKLSARKLLITELIKVSVVAEFKKSFIGLAWLILTPLFVVVSWVVLHGAGILSPGEIGIPYPVYVLVGTSVWGFFLAVYSESSTIVTANSRLLLAADFSISTLLIKTLVVQLIHFSITVVLNIIVILFFGVKLHWLALLFPLSLIPLLFLAVSIGLITALLRVVAIDVAKIIDQGIGFLMFLTPIVYAADVPLKWLERVVHLNPLTYLISMPRDLLTKGQLYEPINYLCCALGAFILCYLTYRFFIKMVRHLLERIINN